MKKRLLIVDDHEVVRLGLEVLLRDSNFEIVAHAKSSAEALEKVTSAEPEIVLLDIRMPGGDGLNCLGRIKLDHADLPVVLYTAHDNPTYIARAVALGASGFILKTAAKDHLIDALETSIKGESAWSKDDLRRVTGALATPRAGNATDVPLTQRETQVLEHLSKGLTNKEIAKLLGISYETVKEHVQHILRKIGVNDRTQAAVWAVRQGLV